MLWLVDATASSLIAAARRLRVFKQGGLEFRALWPASVGAWWAQPNAHRGQPPKYGHTVISRGEEVGGGQVN